MIKSISWRSLQLVGLASLTLVLTSCEQVSGGGWIVSAADPTKKATFGMALSCTDSSSGAVLNGNFEYHDMSFTATTPDGKQQKLGIHGVPVFAGSPIPGSTCSGLDSIFPFAGTYLGTYTTQPAVGPGGAFVVIVVDNGAKGPSKDDQIFVTLSGGLFSGYTNVGTLGGGNLTVTIP